MTNPGEQHSGNCLSNQLRIGVLWLWLTHLIRTVVCVVYMFYEEDLNQMLRSERIIFLDITRDKSHVELIMISYAFVNVKSGDLEK